MSNYTSIIVLCIIGFLILILAVTRLAMFLQWFCRELRYVEKEIDRTHGAEKEHWKKRKKRLWRSLLPFVRY